MWKQKPYTIFVFGVFYVGLLLLILSCYTDGKGGGGRGGGGRGGGRGGGSSRGSSWGSSSPSGSRSSSSYSSGSRTGSSSYSSGRYGSSSPSGSRFAASHGYSRNPMYSSGSSYRAPSKTMSQFSSPGAARSSHPRAQATVPRPAPSAPTTVIYNPVYNSHGSGIGVHHVIGAYYLTRMAGDLTRPHGYYGPSPYQTYVPFRDQYGTYLTTTTPAPTTTTLSFHRLLAQIQSNSNNNYACFMGLESCTTARTTTAVAEPPKLDLCVLARWNREVPFTDLPNMAVQFLSDDSISGNSTAEKSRFLYNLFRDTTAGFDSYNSSSDIFTIPSNSSLAPCNFLPAQGIDVTKPKESPGEEEPIVTSARNILQLYSNISTEPHYIEDLVNASKSCLPRGQQDQIYAETMPCLAFSTDPQYLPKLRNPSSLFGNSEICGGSLNPDLFKCVPSSDASSCKLDHLVALNLFARNYYLCSKAMDDVTVTKVRDSVADALEQYSIDASNSSGESRQLRVPNISGPLFMALVVISRSFIAA